MAHWAKKSWFSEGSIPSGGSRVICFFALSSFWRSPHFHSLAPAPLPHLPNQRSLIFKYLLTLTLQPPSLTRTLDIIGGISYWSRIIFPSRGCWLANSLTAPQPWDITSSQVLGNKVWVSWERHYSAYRKHDMTSVRAKGQWQLKLERKL